MSLSHPTEASEQFARLFAAHQRDVYRYVQTFLPLAVDADEVFQETCVVVWRKFDEFPAEGNFGGWACRVAYFEVLKFYRRRKQERMLLSEDVLELVAQTRSAREEVLEARRAALSDCLEKLRPRDRQLVLARYDGQKTARRVAEELGQPINTVYKALDRIRRRLYQCVNRRLSAEGAL